MTFTADISAVLVSIVIAVTGGGTDCQIPVFKLGFYIQNLTIILQNDPKLKGIVFNELSDCIEIKGDVPWQHPSKYWRDADDSRALDMIKNLMPEGVDTV